MWWPRSGLCPTGSCRPRWRPLGSVAARAAGHRASPRRGAGRAAWGNTNASGSPPLESSSRASPPPAPPPGTPAPGTAPLYSQTSGQENAAATTAPGCGSLGLRQWVLPASLCPGETPWLPTPAPAVSLPRGLIDCSVGRAPAGAGALVPCIQASVRACGLSTAPPQGSPAGKLVPVITGRRDGPPPPAARRPHPHFPSEQPTGAYISTEITGSPADFPATESPAGL